ncbi:hypothetical protein DVH24_009072, partial [Malus domestica]
CQTITSVLSDAICPYFEASVTFARPIPRPLQLLSRTSKVSCLRGFSKDFSHKHNHNHRLAREPNSQARVSLLLNSRVKVSRPLHILMLAIISNLRILCIRCLCSPRHTCSSRLCHTCSSLPCLTCRSRLIKCQYIDPRWLRLVLNFQLGGLLKCLRVLDLMWTCRGCWHQI